MSPEILKLFDFLTWGGWGAGGLLIIRRGFKDKSFGMPLMAVSLDMCWQFYYTFIAYSPPQFFALSAFAFYINCGILTTCYLYGQNDFDWPLLKKHFKFKLLGIHIGVIVIFLCFIKAFDDKGGAIAAPTITLFLSSMLITMILRRDSVKGQSLYIAMFLFLGNISGYAPAIFAHTTGQENAPILWVYATVGMGTVLHIVYIMIYVYVAKRDEVSLWKRF